jgi:hypothetical protein
MPSSSTSPQKGKSPTFDFFLNRDKVTEKFVAIDGISNNQEAFASLKTPKEKVGLIIEKLEDLRDEVIEFAKNPTSTKS